MIFKKYLISLLRAQERRNNAVAQMGRVFGESNFQVIDAFDAKGFINVTGKGRSAIWSADYSHPTAKRVEEVFGEPAQYIVREEFARGCRWLLNNPGSTGCVLSHISVWQDAINSNADVIFVAEDDIEFVNTDLNLYESVAKYVAEQKEATTVLGFYNEHSIVALRKDSYIRLGSHKFYQPDNPNRICSSIGVFHNRPAFTRLYNNLLPVRKMPDIYGYFMSQGWIDQIWCAYPFLMKPGEYETTIATNFGGTDITHEKLVPALIHEVAEVAIKLRVPYVKPYLIRRRERNAEVGTIFI